VGDVHGAVWVLRRFWDVEKLGEQHATTTSGPLLMESQTGPETPTSDVLFMMNIIYIQPSQCVEFSKNMTVTDLTNKMYTVWGALQPPYGQLFWNSGFVSTGLAQSIKGSNTTSWCVCFCLSVCVHVCVCAGVGGGGGVGVGVGVGCGVWVWLLVDVPMGAAAHVWVSGSMGVGVVR
jgi:hypothetical protein